MLALIDLDGPIVDFMSSALKANRSDLPLEKMTKWNAWETLEIPKDEFWKNIEETDNFWEDLSPTSWANDLIAMVEDHGFDWIFCSTPSLDPRSASGKLTWIQRHFPHKARDYSMTTKKFLYAKAWHTLIDDSEINISEYRAVLAGEAIMWPAPWNTMRKVTDPFPYLDGSLTRARKRFEHFRKA